MDAQATHIVEVEDGNGDPAVVSLAFGHELAPVSIGKKAMWKFDAPDLLDLHAYIYFDGRTLFVQSADDRAEVSIGGARIGKTWSPLSPPCAIDVGPVRLRYRALPVSHAPPSSRVPQTPKSIPAPPPMPPSSGRPLVPSPPISEPEESTRVAPIESTDLGKLSMSGANVSLRPTPSQPPPAVLQLPMSGAPYMGASGSPSNAPAELKQSGGYPAIQGLPPQEATTTNRNAVVKGLARFQTFPVPIRVLVFLAPFFLVGLLVLLRDDETPRKIARQRAAIPTQNAPWPAGVPCPPPNWPPNAPLPCRPTAGANTGASVARAMPTPPPRPVATTAVSVPSDVEPVSSGAARTDAGAPRVPAGRTLERRAVDAVAAGDFARAAVLYEELAESDPKRRAFAEAARILRAKLDGGVP